MKMIKIKEVVEVLAEIEEDYSVPKNVRAKVKNAISALEEKNKTVAVKINKSLQELDEISDDSNIPIYTRTQIWNIVSSLSSLENNKK